MRKKYKHPYDHKQIRYMVDQLHMRPIRSILYGLLLVLFASALLTGCVQRELHAQEQAESNKAQSLQESQSKPESDSRKNTHSPQESQSKKESGSREKTESGQKENSEEASESGEKMKFGQESHAQKNPDSQKHADAEPNTQEAGKEPVESPETSPVHTHVWVKETTTIHHEAQYADRWIEDTPAWEETVLVKEAWDESVCTREAFDEEIYETHDFCSACGLDLTAGGIEPGEHAEQHALKGEAAGHYTDQIVSTVHHEAVFETIHHEPEYRTIPHEATGHTGHVLVQEAWDEPVKNYRCSECGATK